MPYIPPEVVEQARQIDLLTYLQSCEPQELVRISGNNYTTRTHDSLKISNGKWMWWSRRIGGYIEKIEKAERLDQCIETIRQRFGKNSIRNGILFQNLRMPSEKPEITMPTGVLC